MMYMDKIDKEKEVGLSDILQELKKQTFINKRQAYIDIVLSSYLILFTIDILLYEIFKNFLASVVSGVIIVVVIFALILFSLKKTKLP